MKITKILIVLFFAFIFNSQVFTQSALARSSGSGELAEFETDNFLTSVGIGMASSFVGNAISEGFSSSVSGTEGATFFTEGVNAEGVAYGGFNGAMSKWNDVGTWTSSYNSVAAMNQLGSGVHTLGQQQGWDNSTTYFVSSVAQGAVGGGVLNPAGSVDTLVAGTIGGVAEGAILANNVDGNGKIKPWVSAAAGLAGTFVRGTVSASIDEVIPGGVETDMSLPKGRDGYIRGEDNKLYDFQGNVKPVPNWTQDSVTGEWSGPQKAVPIKAASFNEAITHGAVNTLSALPSRLISMGVQNMTKDMDRNDAFMTRQAFGGVYPIAGAVYKHEIRDPILIDLDLEHYVGFNGTGDVPIENIGQPRVPIIPTTP